MLKQFLFLDKNPDNRVFGWKISHFGQKSQYCKPFKFSELLILAILARVIDSPKLIFAKINLLQRHEKWIFYPIYLTVILFNCNLMFILNVVNYLCLFIEQQYVNLIITTLSSNGYKMYLIEMYKIPPPAIFARCKMYSQISK